MAKGREEKPHEEEGIRTSLRESYSVIAKHNGELMELDGVDLKKLDRLQKETASELSEIAARIDEEYRGGAKAISEVHRKSLAPNYTFTRQFGGEGWPRSCRRDFQADDCGYELLLWPDTDEASASDAGSDDLTLRWEWDDMTADTVTTYYNDGFGPDPFPSPDVNPVSGLTESVVHIFGAPGSHTIILSVEDDGGVATISVVLRL